MEERLGAREMDEKESLSALFGGERSWLSDRSESTRTPQDLSSHTPDRVGGLKKTAEIL